MFTNNCFYLLMLAKNVTFITAVVDNKQDELSGIDGDNRASDSFEAIIRFDRSPINSSNWKISCGLPQSKWCSFLRHDRRKKNINETCCKQIELTCSAVDQQCSKKSINETYSCSSCSSFDLSSIVRGVQYRCYLSTIKAAFPTTLSDLYTFQTSTSNDE